MINVGFVTGTICDNVVLSFPSSSITNSWPANNLGICFFFFYVYYLQLDYV